MLTLEPIGFKAPAEIPGQPSELLAEGEDRGAYKFRVPPGRYRLLINELSYADPHVYPSELTLDGDVPAKVRYRLPERPTDEIRGVVVDVDGRPVKD